MWSHALTNFFSAGLFELAVNNSARTLRTACRLGRPTRKAFAKDVRRRMNGRIIAIRSSNTSPLIYFFTY